METENPDFKAIQSFLFPFFYERRDRFTNFTSNDKWPAGVLVAQDSLRLGTRYVGSLDLSVSALVPSGLVRYPGATSLKIIAYQPGRYDGQISDPEQLGRVMLHERRISKFEYVGEKYCREFKTLSSLKALLDHVFGSDGVDVEYNSKEDAIVNGIGEFVVPLIVGHFTKEDVNWMRVNGRLKQLVLKLRGEIDTQVESALAGLGIAPDDMKSVFTVPNTLERIDFVMSRISD